MRIVGGFAFLLLAALPAQAQNFATYACADGTVVPVEFYRGARSAHMQIDGKSLRLRRRLFSLAGARYSGAGITLHISRDRITLKRKGQRSIACTAR